MSTIPYKPLRGFHLYLPARSNIPFFKRFVRWMASLGYNTLFLEIAGGMQYDCHPAINEAWEKFCSEANRYPGGPMAFQLKSHPFLKAATHTELAGGLYLEKSEVTDLAAYAREVGIEIIPEVQSLSHVYHLCCAYPEIAERADDRWPDMYCPSNPRSYEILFDVLAEVIDVFHPQRIHIGHDEAYFIGFCPRCQGKSGADLLAEDINRIHTYLAERGIGVCMWADKLMPFSVDGQGGVAQEFHDDETGAHWNVLETYTAIDLIPQDILLLDWLSNSGSRALEYFIEKGFDVIAGNFGNYFSPQTFVDWFHRSARLHFLGGEIATWCDVSEFALGYNGCIFHAMLSSRMLLEGTDLETNRNSMAADAARYMPQVREQLSGEIVPSRRPGATFLQIRLEPFITDTLEFASGLSGIRVDTKHRSVEISIGEVCQSLLLTHACTTRKKRRPSWEFPDPCHPAIENILAKYIIHYQDGEQAEFELHYGTHLARYDVPYGSDIDAIPYLGDPVLQNSDRDNGILYRCEWANSWPERPIKSLEFVYCGDDGGAVWLNEITSVQFS